MSLHNIPNNQFSNENLNSVGSQYAQDFNKDLSLLVQKATNETIFDAAPKQFFDLKLLNMKKFEDGCPSDEFFYKEMGYQRKPMIAIAAAAAVAWPNTQSFQIQDTSEIAENYIVVYPDNTKGTVTDVNTSTGIVTVTPFTNMTLPAVVVDDEFALQAPVEADGTDNFANYFRASTIERSNYIQLFEKTMKYGEMELHKLKSSGTTKNFLSMERKAMYGQFRIDLSNTFWNGQKGEATTSYGEKAKTTGGVYPAMVAAGSPNASTPLANVDVALEEVVLDSEFGEYGDVRFAFAAPRHILAISKKYKDDKTRYKPNDMIAKLGLEEINIGSSRIVLVPFKRFEDSASFPASFANKVIILDMKNITIKRTWGERSGETPDRNDGFPQRYKEMWVDANMGVQFNNPLACAWLDLIV